MNSLTRLFMNSLMHCRIFSDNINGAFLSFSCQCKEIFSSLQCTKSFCFKGLLWYWYCYFIFCYEIFSLRFGFWIESSSLPWNLDSEFNQWWVTCRKEIQHSNALEIFSRRFPLRLVWQIFKVCSSDIFVTKRLKRLETKIPKDIRDLSWMQRSKPLIPHSYVNCFAQAHYLLNCTQLLIIVSISQLIR